jgi:selenium metabolism protein YedF
VLLAKDALDRIEEGEVQILVDGEVAVGNLTRLAGSLGLGFEVERKEGYYEVRIRKGGEAKRPQAESEGRKGILLVVATDTLGKDEDLGKILMKAFLETMLLYGPPDTIFLMNAGVRLSTTHDEMVGILKDIESMGAKILSCGTCLKFYGLEDKLQVGQVGGMNVLVEGAKNFEKMVFIG